MRLPRIVTAVSAVTLLTLAGCGTAFEQRRLDFSDTEEVKITQVNVAPGSGDIVIRTGDVSNVQIKRVLRYRGGEPRGGAYRVEGTQLYIDTDCGRQCSVSYDIFAPRGTALQGENGSGDVELTGLADVDIKVGSGNIEVRDASGAVRTETGSGDISLTGVKGTASGQTGSGNISGRGLAGGVVKAETGSGDISLALAGAGSVRANASSGSVVLSVPAGSYRVQCTTESGSKAIEVANDPAATMLLDVTTGSGDVTIKQS
jgi:hypothetical protein